MSILSKIRNIFPSKAIVSSAQRVPFSFNPHIGSVEEKSHGMFGLGSSLMTGYGSLNSNYQTMSSLVSTGIYSRVAPVSVGIDLIADEVASIEPKFLENNEFVDHEILQLLKQPNADMTTSEFMKRLSAFYLITGNAFIVATGDVNRAPLEIQVIPSQYISSILSDTDGFVKTYEVNPHNSQSFNETFTRFENPKDKNFRFFNSTMDRELWHIKDFNPFSNEHGLSRLQSVYIEISQYAEANNHNLAILQNGISLSLILSVEDGGDFDSRNALTDDQMRQLEEQLDNFFSGSANAQKAFICPDPRIKVKTVTSQLDSDYKELLQRVSQQVFTRLKIPLPLISPENMTFDNMANAKLSLYDNAVTPLATRLYQEITLFLRPRYDLAEDQSLSFSRQEIAALQPRRDAELRIKNEINAYTINELRTIAGDEALDEGGDVILRPANILPIAQDEFTEDQRDRPVKPPDKEKYISMLKGQGYSQERAELIFEAQVSNDSSQF